jgi:pimeloyl-ACP methyl ester carboxylesterase
MTANVNKSGWGRVVALAIIGVMLLGLGYLRFAPGDGLLSVPAGAQAGDLILEPCSYDTENGRYDADCGTLFVPENRANPQSRLIALPVIRIRALSDQPAEPIFPLEGGPGITNMVFKQASRYDDEHDVVLVGYRGVDGSVRLDCPEVTSALKHASDWLSQDSFRAYGDGLRACADRLTAEGVDLAGYGLPQRIDDLEAARVALDYERINLLSQSAGTRTAIIYAWRFPDRIHRSVMIGVNPPGHFLWDPRTHDEQIGRYAELCASDPSCRARTDDLSATMRAVAADMPERWLFLPINQSSVRFVTFFGLMESLPNDQTPIAAPMTVDAWLAAAEGDASGFWFVSLFNDLFTMPFVWGEYAAAGIIDAQVSRDYFSSNEPDSTNLGWVASAFVWGDGRLADAWPNNLDEDAYSTVRTSEVETLLIGGALDTSTPPQGATEELLPHLPNGHQVVLSGLGHTGSFFAEQPEAGNHLINTFFNSGQVDDSLYTPITVDFTPRVTLTALAKAVAGIMIGLVLITVASLLWLPYRVRTRGGFGRATSAALRSVYPIVLGLGGWFLGVLIATKFFRTLPLDNVLLAVVSIGVPIGLGIYWAWAQGGWIDRTKTVGFAVAMASAFVGAWLGFSATDGLLALITTIAGAAAVTNLSLIVYDIWRERPARETVAAEASQPAFPRSVA